MPNRRAQTYTYKTSENVERKTIKPVVYFIMLFLTIFSVLNMRKIDTSSSVLPFATVSNEPESVSELTLAIRKKLQEEEGIYSIRFEDFESKNAFGINDEMVVTAASVIKIPVLAALYYLADQKDIDLDEEISIPEQDMQRWGTGVIQYEEAGATFSYRDLAQVLMEHSDNTALYVLANRVIGLEHLQSLIDQWGLDHTDYLKNDTSNKDMNNLLRLMYYGEIVKNDSLNEEMIGWMDDSEFELRLPKYLPSDIPVYHKIGNEVRVTHDVGIIDLQGKPYYLGILGTDIPDHEHATDIIAQISLMVYEYQNQQLEFDQ